MIVYLDLPEPTAVPERHVFPLDEKFSVLFPNHRDFLRLNVHLQSRIVRSVWRSRRVRNWWLLSQRDGDSRWLSPTPCEDLLNFAFESPNLQFKTNQQQLYEYTP